MAASFSGKVYIESFELSQLLTTESRKLPVGWIGLRNANAFFTKLYIYITRENQQIKIYQD